MKVLSFGEPLVGFYPPSGKKITDDVPITKTWGGDTSNFAIGIARLGLESSYLTRIGLDVFGEGFLKLWRENGVDTSLVQTDPERRTGLYFISFEGLRHRFTYYRKESAAANISSLPLTSDLVGKFDLVHMSGISLGMGPSGVEAAMKLLSLARELSVAVSFDVNYRPAQWPDADSARAAILGAVSEGVDYLEITDDEMAALGLCANQEELPEVFPSAKTILAKMGPKGSWIHAAPSRSPTRIRSKDSRSISFYVPAFSVEVKDSVGAGDSFDAGYIAAISYGYAPRKAARFATAAAALTCTGAGPLEKMPFKDDIIHLLRNYTAI